MSVHKQAAALLGVLCCGGIVLAEVSAGEAPVEWHFADPALQWGPCPEFMPAGCAIAVLHGDPARENADIFFKVPAGADVPRHSHTSAERMVLVSGELRVTYDGHDAVVMTPGSYAYGPPQLPHDAFCSGPQACVLAIAFEQPVDAFLQEAGER
jgi:quercetin dioxygenase-like cupin family protein